MAQYADIALRLRRVRVPQRTLFLWLVMAVVGLLVVFPVFMVLRIGFDITTIGEQTRYGLANWVDAWNNPQIRPALWNTVRILLTREVIAVAVGTLFAWLITRTNIPAASWLEFGFWVSLFMPTLAVIQGWMFLLEGQTGLINQWLAALPFIEEGPFEIFSFWGIIWTHLMANNVTAIVILLSLSFRQMDSSLEEAARVFGASPLATLRRVTIPLMRPMYGLIIVIGVIRGLQSFEIEWILGTPARIDIFGTLLVTFIRDDDPEYGIASAMATAILMSLVPLILFHRLFLGRRHYTTVSGRRTFQPIDLGRLRWPTFGLVFGTIMLLTTAPFLSMVVGSFMTRWGFFSFDPAWTLDHWRIAITDPTFVGALVSTIRLGLVAASVTVPILFLIAYILVRLRFAGRSALDFVTWLPWAIPGILLSFGILIMVLNIPVLRVFHGTMFTLVLAVVFFRLPLGAQLLKSGLMQVSTELEEAARVSGARWWFTQIRVVIPILRPMLVAIWLLTFISAVNEVSGIILLASTKTRTLSLLSVDLVFNGEREAAAVVTTIIVLIAIGMALIGRKIGFRLGTL